MVVGRIAVEVIKLGARSLVKYSGKEKSFWASRYGRTGGRAVRHGLAIGPGIGSLLSNSGDTPGNGTIPFSNENVSNQSNQARGRFKRSSNRKYSSTKCRCGGNRYAYSGKYKRSFNR